MTDTKSNSDPIRVGVAGLGRSGWDIHIRTLRHMGEKFKVVAVVDNLPERRKQAAEELGCKAYTSYGKLLADPDVELAVVAMPTDLHVPWAVKALRAGKQVVVEKPVARNLRECDRLIKVAGETGLSVTVFQNRRYDATFLKIRELVTGGALGRVNFLRYTGAGFGRRWDWQTVKARGGGQLRNNVIHALDELMEFSGPADPEIFCKMDNVLSSGDAEDWVQLVLKAPDAPTMEVDIFSNCAYPQATWLVLGQKGSLTSAGSELKWKVVKGFESLPPRPLDLSPTPDRGYNREKLEFEESSWTEPPAPSGPNAPRPETMGFYDDVHASLRGGAPQKITLESVRRRMKVIDHCLKKCGI
ncbi:MAG TPA: Gfo/Idh/MocA family oxidoreductase [Planctomycetota bacterium]|nr:Gfo/Idh/MocA family oxidoreductase [Planctomycetota bacterium]